jgi:hypothetical protein
MNSVPLNSKLSNRDIIFSEWNGTQWRITCPFFIPLEDKINYKCLTFNGTTDKIQCGKHKRKTRPYMIHSAYRCWNCALRHRYCLPVRNTKV